MSEQNIRLSKRVLRIINEAREHVDTLSLEYRKNMCMTCVYSSWRIHEEFILENKRAVCYCSKFHDETFPSRDASYVSICFEHEYEIDVQP